MNFKWLTLAVGSLVLLAGLCNESGTLFRWDITSEMRFAEQ